MLTDSTCPCGSGRLLLQCCGPLLSGQREAASPEELMRSRYSAYATGDGTYVWRTWHPRTRPGEVDLSEDDTSWTRLEVLEAHDDVVEFRASWRLGDDDGTLHERSRFARRAGRWFYLDGERL